MSTKSTAEDCPIIALDRFIQATRDSGYKGTASAVSELIDNSLQAGASEIQILLAEVGGEFPVEVRVVDNGCGMDPFTLRQALRFGGSSRFGDRSGLGRYGMGLPNSSLSQAVRVTVYTWRTLDDRPNVRKGKRAAPDEVYSSYLDVDEIASGTLSQVPVPHKTQQIPPHCVGKSGTLVHWERCDRLDNRRISTLAKKLSIELGRRFRHFIWNGVRIQVNGEPVRAIDPLFLRGDRAGAELFGEELTYEIAIDPSDKSKGTSVVRVRFSELPVHEWQALSNDEKRDQGISKGAGVSIVRAGREVDYGWFFIEKRRENYDDWWRCEVRFEPALDEAFGITHTKQQIRPRPHLADVLTPDIEETARILNGRARKAHLDTKAQERFGDVEKLAGERDRRMAPLPSKGDSGAQKLLGELKKKTPALRAKKQTSGTGYKIVERPLDTMEFYRPVYDGERLVLVINPEHSFYKRLYGPLVDSDKADDKALRERLALFLLAAARAEVALGGARNRDAIQKFRNEWSNTLATLLDV
ncbi:MAG TPA: ATP-binding protein [Kofleriaceae bacterium]|nr:ATP-binding protein [Kofleriaceae bacterium]